MSNVIRIKKSGVTGATPNSLELGELSINYTDGKLFYRDNAGVIQSFSGAGSPGIEISPTPPEDTNVLWVDTSDPASLAVPAGGTTGQVLVKNSNTDFDTSWSNKPGMVLVKVQQIGSAESSVVVSNAFSSAYENYVIIVNGGVGSIDQIIRLNLGSSNTGYYYGAFGFRYDNAGVLQVGESNVASFARAGFSTASNNSAHIQLEGPNLVKTTGFSASYSEHRTIGGSGGVNVRGFHNVAAAYTSFTLSVVGSMTGGNVYVYGYNV